ncbi:type II toxin-antitoxin system PemK/MazF family toxin [Pinirhizobacter sp.]|uniref:type II toxin-antitoxin system PemK/MazF family toxin n=1 Tax=Pinirhizobacter sp. TaxID=2950432 RepID=UPI0039C92A2A
MRPVALDQGGDVGLLRVPRNGAVVLCMFPGEFVPPEMVKTRPVVVVSPRIPGRDELVSIIALSTTAPEPRQAHHCEIPMSAMPKSLQANERKVWAKCDMIYTFRLSRL